MRRGFQILFFLNLLVCSVLLACRHVDDGFTIDDPSSSSKDQPQNPPPSAQGICGDGVLDAGEECDNGNANSNTADQCRTTCKLSACGDGIVDTGEECDNGPNNGNAPDQCRTTCKKPVCGDGIIDSGEQCDGGSGCDAACQLVTAQCTEYVVNAASGGCNFDNECNSGEACAQQSSFPRKCVTKFTCGNDNDCLTSITQCSFRMFCLVGVCR
ncbi:MAG: hypothetical protein U1F57_03700 [bacterium]